MIKQKGMTFIGMLLTVALVVVIGIVMMRVVPVYLGRYSITSSMSALSKIPARDFSSDPSANAQVLKSKLMNQLYVNGVEIPPEQVQIVPNGPDKFLVKIKYQVIKPLVGHISLLFVFDESNEVTIGR